MFTLKFKSWGSVTSYDPQCLSGFTTCIWRNCNFIDSQQTKHQNLLDTQHPLQILIAILEKQIQKQQSAVYLWTTLPSVTFHYHPDSSSKSISLLYLKPMKYEMIADNALAPLTVKFANVKWCPAIICYE